MMSETMRESGLDELTTSRYRRRDFLKRSALAGATVIYAAPLIESLNATHVYAMSGSPRPPSPCQDDCSVFGSCCYVCAVTKGFGQGNFAGNCATINAAVATAQTLSAEPSPLSGINNITNNGKMGGMTFGSISTTGCGDSLKSFLGGHGGGGNNSCGTEDLGALAIMVALNLNKTPYNIGSCNTGLGLQACVSVPASLGLGATATVGAVLSRAIAEASTFPAGGGGKSVLCGDPALVNLIHSMAQDISGMGGPYLGVAC